jgi:hypothetical protein
MQQSIAVFSNAAARTAAITTPLEGQMTWLEDVNAYQYWNGTAWVSAARGTGAGLIHIATQTVSGVTAINFNDCFSSAFTNYKVVVDGGATTRNELFARLRVGGVPASGSDYIQALIFRDVTGLTSVYNTGTAASIGFTENTKSISSVDIGNPFTATKTSFAAVGASAAGAVGAIIWLAGNGHNLTNSYDGISILSANAFTGQVSVYGYRN